MSLARTAIVALVLGLHATSGVAGSVDQGVVVVSVEEDGAATQVGIAPDDLLQRWRVRREGHQPEQGPITSPWALMALGSEHAGGAAVELSGRRRGEDVTFVLAPPKEWGILVDPTLSGSDRNTLRQGVAKIDSGVVEEGFRQLQELADSPGVSAERAAWFLFRAGLALEGAGELRTAAEVLEEALQRAPKSEHVLIHAKLAEVLLQSGVPEEAVVHAERAITLHSENSLGSGLGLVKVMSLLAAAQLQLMHADDAAQTLDRAHSICLRRGPQSMAMVAVVGGQGGVALRRGELDIAEERYERALELLGPIEPSGPRAAATYHNLGAIAVRRGLLDEAEELFADALVIREDREPDSLNLAATLVALGIVEYHRGRLGASEAYAHRAVELQRRHAPGSQSETYGLELLGAATWERGDLARAESCFLRVLEIREGVAPGNVESATCLNNLGAVAQRRGDYVRAEQYYRRALAIWQEKAPEDPNIALSLHNLGNVAWMRDDRDAAETYMRQALAVRQKQSPDSVYVAEAYANLSAVARDTGRAEEAEELAAKALACWEAANPDSLNVALVLGNLGDWKIKEGDLDGAEKLLARSLQIRETMAPGGTENAWGLRSMGRLAAGRGQMEKAEAAFRESISMFSSTGIATRDLAQTRHRLGCLLRDVGRTSEALEVMSQAINDLEAVVGRLGGSEEDHSRFRAKNHDMYQDLIDLLVEVGREEEAFHLLERSRARGFLSLLEQRDLLFSLDISAELDRERRLARAEVEKITVELSRTPADQAEVLDELRKALQESRMRYNEVQQRIRDTAPRLAALTAPEPLTLPQSRQALDEGTVALSYSVGKEHTQLFVVGPGPDDFRVVTLGLSDAALRHKIRRLRNAATEPVSGQATIERISRNLTGLLLAPATREITRARRILVVPDGPLHLLPFGMLQSPEGGSYLIEERPVHQASSITLFAELKAERHDNKSWRVAGLGAPVYSSETGEPAPALLTAIIRGQELYPLPWTREEVASLEDTFKDAASVWLGAEATEERARVAGTDAEVLHLACHGLVDEHLPLESALALSIPATSEDSMRDGLLQAWEIIEGVRLDARLVVLSACRTALGQELAGEGIVGLTRAFQFAGAHSVVASLWAVSDRSTAELMRRFYGHLESGLSTDQALRAAQLELASGPVRTANGELLDATHPFFWAAFQLSGDWF